MNSEKNIRFVAYFDMLGMKSAIRRNQDEAWRALCSINQAKGKIYEKQIEIIATGERIGDRVRTYIFSDSVIIFTLSDEPKDLRAILMYSSEFFKDSLSQCIPLRGGIAHGDFFFNINENLFLGKAFVDAYEINEGVQWYGIIVDAETHRRSLTLTPPFQTDTLEPGIVEYEIPLKNNKRKKGVVINWPCIFKHNFMKKPKSVEELYSPFRHMFGEYRELKEEVKLKHINTFNFVIQQLDFKES